MATLKNTKINDSGYFQLPTGSSAERPLLPEVGYMRYNTTTSLYEVYNGTEWKGIRYDLVIPTWNTPESSLGSAYTETSDSFTVSASTEDGSSITYSVNAGSLPGGYSLNSSTGTISGVGSGVADYSNATSTFTIRATSESGGTSDRQFSITLFSRYVGISCATAGENGTVSDSAPSGMVFNRVNFSSYGTPNGSCGAFTVSDCNSTTSNYYDPTPTTSYSVAANNATWGDPCPGIVKRMYIEMAYGPF